jgi:hypothetical protein
VQANAIHLDEGAFRRVPALSPARGKVVDKGESAEGTKDAGNYPSTAVSTAGSSQEVHRYPLRAAALAAERRLSLCCL